MLGYPLPDVLVDFVVRLCATGLVRGVARATHNFTNQCFLDELARTTGKDPCPLDAERREGAERRAAVGGIGELVVSMSEEDEG